MKKLIFAFIALSTMVMEAQNITDGVRYSTSELNGTARFRAMSGAFGALGGDLSAINVNPAGSAVFLRSYASLTMNLQNTENEVSYFNGFNSNSDSDIGMGQAGAVFVFNNTDESSDWRKFSLGINYSKTADFDDDFVAAGRNTRSIDEYFLNYAQGMPLELLQLQENESISDLYSYLGEYEGFGAQQAFLGYQGFILDADPNTAGEYISLVGEGTFNQQYSYAATGLNGKFTFNFATQFQDAVYLGINLNTHFLNYDRFVSLSETNNNSGGDDIQNIYFEDRLNTIGSGVSVQLGAIAKLGNMFRVGASYETPTWYNISEETSQYLETMSFNNEEAIVAPNVINVYPDYTLQTPGKYTGSLAVLFGGRGLISFDYSYKDYSAIKFKPTGDPEFAFQNSVMEEELKGAATYRLGGEYRFGSLSLRGGYRFEESPYQDETSITDLEGYSAGLGYSFGSLKIDLAYDAAEQDRNSRLFQVGLTDRAMINRNISNYTLTVSFGI